MLLGMVHPTSGTGSIFGHRIDREKESLLIRQKVAFVAEDKRLCDYMTVGQIVRFTKSFFSRVGITNWSVASWNSSSCRQSEGSGNCQREC
jgi:ABC-type multidrug transport system ATPase subunit